MQGILAERSLCPHVIATTEEIIVTEYISGKVLSEQDMLDNSELMESLADL
jgi:predicted unusual protein kinase regulating ubiquinone biosynthesis (AarF/ABC1/UbiB family)